MTIDIEKERREFEAWVHAHYKHPKLVLQNIRSYAWDAWRAAKSATDKDAVLGERLAAANGVIGVLVDLLRDVLMPLSVSKMDAMTSGEEDDYRMISDLQNRIKAAIHSAPDTAITAMQAEVKL